MAIGVTIPDHLKKKPAAPPPKEGGPDLRKRWPTPYGFADFTTPVSYDEACHCMKTLQEKYFGKDER